MKPDTYTVLRTMRAVIADEPSERVDMTRWFHRGQNCGCILGLTCDAQPLFAQAVGLRLRHGPYEGFESALLGSTGALHNDPGSWAEIASLVGVTQDEAEYLFNQTKYPGNACMFDDGKAEALRRLDEVIARYAPAPARAALAKATAR